LSGGGGCGNLSRHAQDIRSSHLKMKNNNPPIRKPAIQGTSLKMPSMVPLGAAANFPRSPRPIQTVESNKQTCVIAVANPIDQKDQKSASNKSTVPTSPASTEELMKKICELIGDRSNGVWSTCVAVEFRKKFKTELPNDWIKRIQSLKNSSNILKFVQHIGDIYIVYVAVPSSEEKNEVTLCLMVELLHSFLRNLEQPHKQCKYHQCVEQISEYYWNFLTIESSLSSHLEVPS
jgi:hypothetical protein